MRRHEYDFNFHEAFVFALFAVGVCHDGVSQPARREGLGWYLVAL